MSWLEPKLMFVIFLFAFRLKGLICIPTRVTDNKSTSLTVLVTLPVQVFELGLFYNISVTVLGIWVFNSFGFLKSTQKMALKQFSLRNGEYNSQITAKKQQKVIFMTRSHKSNLISHNYVFLIIQIFFIIRFDFETISTHKLLVNFTNNCKEMASNTWN